MRIFQTRRELPRSELARLTQIDYDREMAFIAEAVDAQGVRETLGVARTVSDPDRVEAEFAIIVRSDLKGAGLGRLLLQQLIEHARNRGTSRLVGLSIAGAIGPWGYLGIVPLSTGLLGACPAYALFGVSTCARDRPRGRPGRP